jgi:predicted ATPase with chaperone activity
MIRKFCAISAEGEKLLENAITKLGLSARTRPHLEGRPHDCGP